MYFAVPSSYSRHIVTVQHDQTFRVSTVATKRNYSNTLLRTAFRTGATGYIGGDFLHAIMQAHPELAITALVRQQSAATKLKELYPHIDTVEGDLDSTELLAKAGVEFDVILSLYISLVVAQTTSKPFQILRPRATFPA